MFSGYSNASHSTPQRPAGGLSSESPLMTKDVQESLDFIRQYCNSASRSSSQQHNTFQPSQGRPSYGTSTPQMQPAIGTSPMPSGYVPQSPTPFPPSSGMYASSPAENLYYDSNAHAGGTGRLSNEFQAGLPPRAPSHMRPSDGPGVGGPGSKPRTSAGGLPPSQYGGASPSAQSDFTAASPLAPRPSEPYHSQSSRQQQQQLFPPQQQQQPQQQQRAPQLNGASPETTDLLTIVWYLRRRYGDEGEESSLGDGLESLTDSDIVGLMECFQDEVLRAARDARAQNPTAPSRQPSPARQPSPYQNSEVPPAPQYRPPPSPPQDSRGGAPVTNHSVTSTMHEIEARHSRQPSLSQFALANHHPKQMTLRDAMAMFRRGLMMIKYGRRGNTPLLRFFSVQDRRTLHRGELIAMPHLCWSADPRAEPSGQVPLTHLTGVTRGPQSKGFRRNDNGDVVGLKSEVMDQLSCFTLKFSERDVDIAARSVDDASLWVGGFLMILERNKNLPQDGN